MEILLKALTAGDAQELDAWLDPTDLGNYMSGWTPRSVHDGHWLAELCRWHLIWVDGKRIGMVWLTRNTVDDRIADLGILIAKPEDRGRGIGGAVVPLAEQDGMESWGLEAVRLRVRASNTRAISCYRSAGYRVAERAIKEIDGSSFEVLHMEHVLSLRSGR